jgi:hypothetical protein
MNRARSMKAAMREPSGMMSIRTVLLVLNKIEEGLYHVCYLRRK